MKKWILATVLVAFSAFGYAEEVDPNVSIAQSANANIAQCMTAFATGSVGMSADAKALLITQAPRMCKEAMHTPTVKQAPGASYYIWDGVKFALGIWAGYKDKQMMWGAITGIVDRMGDSNDAAVSGGYDIASQGIEAAEKPPLVVRPEVIQVPAGSTPITTPTTTP